MLQVEQPGERRPSPTQGKGGGASLGEASGVPFGAYLVGDAH